MRRLIAFPCAGETLIGTLDEGVRSVGLLIVAGGNEVRMGAHRGMALLATRLSARGYAVFRFDRRGIGDSGGVNRGYAHSCDDIIAATDAFRAACPDMAIMALGNCDAATALALYGQNAAINALLLTNPWLGDEGELPPAAAIRARYKDRIRDLRSWRRLITGNVSFRLLLRGLRKISGSLSHVTTDQAPQIAAALSRFPGAVSLVLAERDATGLAFAAAWRGPVFRALRARVPVTVIPTASHSFAREEDAAALEAAIIAALEKTASTA